MITVDTSPDPILTIREFSVEEHSMMSLYLAKHKITKVESTVAVSNIEASVVNTKYKMIKHHNPVDYQLMVKVVSCNDYGMKHNEVAEMYGISLSDVRALLSKAKALGLYIPAESTTLGAIAETLNVTHTTVNRDLSSALSKIEDYLLHNEDVLESLHSYLQDFGSAS